MKSKYTILIVDEENEAICTLRDLLEQETYTVDIARSAIHALDKVKNDKYHIVLIDINMPEMDGLELLREIKSYDALTQVVMMAEHSTMDRVLSSLEYGASDYIMKPINDVAYVKQVIDYSVQKLERWRECIIQLVV